MAVEAQYFVQRRSALALGQARSRYQSIYRPSTQLLEFPVSDLRTICERSLAVEWRAMVLWVTDAVDKGDFGIDSGRRSRKRPAHDRLGSASTTTKPLRRPLQRASGSPRTTHDLVSRTIRAPDNAAHHEQHLRATANRPCIAMCRYSGMHFTRAYAASCLTFETPADARFPARSGAVPGHAFEVIEITNGPEKIDLVPSCEDVRRRADRYDLARLEA